MKQLGVFLPVVLGFVAAMPIVGTIACQSCSVTVYDWTFPVFAYVEATNVGGCADCWIDPDPDDEYETYEFDWYCCMEAMEQHCDMACAPYGGVAWYSAQCDGGGNMPEHADCQCGWYSMFAAAKVQ
jgi:hypothetical protein